VTHPLTRTSAGDDLVGSLGGMSFEAPAPDLKKLLSAWEEWERGEETPGKVLANMKTAGFPTVLHQLIDSGWSPASS
jgi:hypothetical protein